MITNINNSLRAIKDESQKLNDSERKGVDKLLDMLLTLRQQRTLRNSFEKEQERNEEQ
jgi:hypothetical protein